MKRIFLAAMIFLCLQGCKDHLNSEDLEASMKSSDPDQLQQIVSDGAEQSEELDSMSLILLSAIAIKNQDYVNSELFMYKAMLRAAVDKVVYPATGTGGESPLLPLMGLNQSLALALRQGPQKSAEQYQHMMDEIEKWNPVCTASYKPGWKYKGNPNLALCKQSFAKIKNKNLVSMKQQLVFYNHPYYFSLLRQWRGLNMKYMYSSKEKQDQKFVKLQNELIAIESELGVEGEVTKYTLMPKEFQQ